MSLTDEKKQQMEQVRIACEPHLHQRALSAAEAETARQELHDLVSVATFRAEGWAWGRGIFDKAHGYAFHLSAVADADEEILALIEPHEIEMVHSCVILREEIKRLRTKINLVGDRAVEWVMIVRKDEILFLNWPLEEDDNGNGA